MTSYLSPPSAAVCPWLRNTVTPHSPSLLPFSNFNFLRDSPTYSRSRTYIVLASADGEKQQREADQGIETESSEMLDLKFGHPIGETTQETFAKEGEVDDWLRAESLHKSGELEEVELVSCFKSGFAVSFGSLIGFLPCRDLGPERRPFSFEAWLQEKGLDPSTFKKDIEAGCSTLFESKMSTLVLTTFPKNKGSIQSAEQKHAAMTIREYQNLLDLYYRDRTSFLSYFVGQKTRARVTSVDRKSGRLLFSEKLREGRDFGKKKADLMLEGVEALIHHSQLSWEPVWDVHSFLKVGEVVKAKVFHLDHSLQRISLSLKQMQPDQVLGTLESVINEENGPTKRNLEPAEFKNEWPEVGSLIRELELVDGIHSVSKGRLLLSPRWASRFQVSLSDSHGTQYKILARSEHRVQEIIIQASLSRDEMKSAILSFHPQWCEKIDGQ